MLLLLVAVLYSQLASLPQAQAALRGMGAVAAGLIAATGLKLVTALRNNVMGLSVCTGFAALTFVAIALLRWPLAWVLLGLGTLSCAWAWRQLGRTGG